jgi:hypothetical protein
VDGMEDVKHERCEHEECSSLQPVFNYKCEKVGRFCAKHKVDGMEDVKHERCEHEECSFRPYFNYKGEKVGRFCKKHKVDGMEDVKNKRCASEWCDTFIQKKYKGYCLLCYINLFPGEPVSRNYKTKETAVVDHVKGVFSDYTWVCDKRVGGGCSRRRPDMLLDLLDQVLMVEVDENRHADYDSSCENKRMMELSQDVGHCPIVFIRFNPDKYDNVTSCWGFNKNGICTVKKTKQKEWSTRLDTLVKSILHWIDNRTSKTVEVEHLFF